MTRRFRNRHFAFALLPLWLFLCAALAAADKICPQCHRHYWDSDNFCTVDGTHLVTVHSKHLRTIRPEPAPSDTAETLDTPVHKRKPRKHTTETADESVTEGKIIHADSPAKHTRRHHPKPTEDTAANTETPKPKRPKALRSEDTVTDAPPPTHPRRFTVRFVVPHQPEGMHRVQFVIKDAQGAHLAYDARRPSGTAISTPITAVGKKVVFEILVDHRMLTQKRL